MNKLYGLLFALTICVSFSGCGGNEGGSITESAEQSAIEAYQEAEAAEQAALQTEMSAGLEAEGVTPEPAAPESAE